MPMYRVSAKALIYNENKQFLLIQEKKGIRDFPGGGIEYGETPQEAIKRELSEEMRIIDGVIVNKKITTFVPYYDEEKEIGIWLAFYETELPKNTEITLGDSECIAYNYFSVEEAKTLALHSNVKHFLSQTFTN